MRFIVVSKQCPAAMNIKDRLLELVEWEKAGEYEGEAVFSSGKYTMITIQDYHIYAEGIDEKISKELGLRPDLIIFPSKHRSESGKRSLTVHPVGNYGEAQVGGKDFMLSPSAPNYMTEALRQLKMFGSGLDYSISFEVTHHGPFLNTPAFFIEIGSDEKCWQDEDAARAIAHALLELAAKDYPTAIGLGGGHYAPRFSDVALKKRIAFGHMIPNYAIESVNEDMVRKLVEATPGLSYIYFHKKKSLTPRVEEFIEWFERYDVVPVEYETLEDL